MILKGHHLFSKNYHWKWTDSSLMCMLVEHFNVQLVSSYMTVPPMIYFIFVGFRDLNFTLYLLTIAARH